MPYIKQIERVKFGPVLNEFKKVSWHYSMEVGDMNYLITKMIHILLKQKGLRYQYINDMIGVLECAKLELYRKIASKYEDEKEKIHGGV